MDKFVQGQLPQLAQLVKENTAKRMDSVTLRYKEFVYSETTYIFDVDKEERPAWIFVLTDIIKKTENHE